MRENGGSLNFNFVSLLNSAVDENWVCRHVCCSSSLENDAMYDVPSCANFLWTADFWGHKYTFLLFSSAHFIAHELQSSYSIHHQFWLCRCVNFRLCCTHFSCHRHKMCNVSRWLTQISRRQCDPCKLICVNVTCKACTEYNCDQSSVCTLWSQLYSVQALLDLHMPENKIEALWRMCCHYHEYVLQPLFSNSILHLKM